MLRFSCGDYSVGGCVGDLPQIYSSYATHAALHEEIDISSSKGTVLFVSVKKGTSEWPSLVVAQRFESGSTSGFFPGICWPQKPIFSFWERELGCLPMTQKISVGFGRTSANSALGVGTDMWM
jgi:hypothetical protein